MLNIFIGWDSKEILAFHVLSHSILTRATRPVSITALIQPQLRASSSYTRERGPLESTEFSMTRFLVPYLSNYKGISLFMDCDMLCLADITDLEFIAASTLRLSPDDDEYDESKEKSVWVCQHDYTPVGSTKFLDQPQTVYPRKNWSSLMLFNNAKCKALTPQYVNSASGLELHRFHWTSDDQIGSLPLSWNWLVNEPGYDYRPNIDIAHFTLGGPWFPEYATVPYADQWFAERNAMLGG